MRRVLIIIISLSIGLLSGCTINDQQTEILKPNIFVENNILDNLETDELKNITSMQIKVINSENIIVFELNDSQAAKELYAQLPLSIEVEDYSDNEKIFYPPEKLNIAGTPLADAKNGTLAYYAPWGDVVMFFGDFGSANGLYEIGKVVSGGEHIKNLSGNVEILDN